MKITNYKYMILTIIGIILLFFIILAILPKKIFGWDGWIGDLLWFSFSAILFFGIAFLMTILS